jgi:hypothetical protein
MTQIKCLILGNLPVARVRAIAWIAEITICVWHRSGAVRLRSPHKRTALTNISPTLEQRRRWAQKRLRLIDPANQRGQQIEHEHHEEDVDDRPPQQHAEHAPRLP